MFVLVWVHDHFSDLACRVSWLNSSPWLMEDRWIPRDSIEIPPDVILTLGFLFSALVISPLRTFHLSPQNWKGTAPLSLAPFYMAVINIYDSYGKKYDKSLWELGSLCNSHKSRDKKIQKSVIWSTHVYVLVFTGLRSPLPVYCIWKMDWKELLYMRGT